LCSDARKLVLFFISISIFRGVPHSWRDSHLSQVCQSVRRRVCTLSRCESRKLFSCTYRENGPY
jgi:hypothetical protein